MAERERRRVNEWATITETTLTTTRISRGYKVRGEKPFHPLPFPPLSAPATFICSERVAANNGRITMACLPWIEILVNFTHAHRVSSSVFGYWEHDDLDEARFSRTCYVTRGSLSISFFYIFLYIYYSFFFGDENCEFEITSNFFPSKVILFLRFIEVSLSTFYILYCHCSSPFSNSFFCRWKWNFSKFLRWSVSIFRINNFFL